MPTKRTTTPRRRAGKGKNPRAARRVTHQPTRENYASDTAFELFVAWSIYLKDVEDRDLGLFETEAAVGLIGRENLVRSAAAALGTALDIVVGLYPEIGGPDPVDAYDNLCVMLLDICGGFDPSSPDLEAQVSATSERYAAYFAADSDPARLDPYLAAHGDRGTADEMMRLTTCLHRSAVAAAPRDIVRNTIAKAAARTAS